MEGLFLFPLDFWVGEKGLTMLESHAENAKENWIELDKYIVGFLRQY